MRGITAQFVSLLVALGLLLGASAPVYACGGCCCKGGKTLAADKTPSAEVFGAGCCGCNVAEAGPAQSALPELAVVYNHMPGQSAGCVTPSSSPRLAGETAVNRAHNLRARSSPPLFKLTSSYLC